MDISIKEKTRKKRLIQDSLETAAGPVPDYLSLEKDGSSGKLLVSPQLEAIENQLPLPINIPVVCEFISHGT